MQNIFLILCDNPDIQPKPSQTSYEDSQAFCSVLCPWIVVGLLSAMPKQCGKGLRYIEKDIA